VQKNYKHKQQAHKNCSTKTLPYKKADSKMLVRLSPFVNFTNILQAYFAPIFFHKKIQNQTVSREELQKSLLYKKLLVKCWCNCHLVSILLYSQYSFAKKLQSQTVSREKLRKTLWYVKAVRKMLVNLSSPDRHDCKRSLSARRNHPDNHSFRRSTVGVNSIKRSNNL